MQYFPHTRAELNNKSHKNAHQQPMSISLLSKCMTHRAYTKADDFEKETISNFIAKCEKHP